MTLPTDGGATDEGATDRGARGASATDDGAHDEGARPASAHDEDARTREAVAEIDRLDAACRAEPDDVDHQIRLWQAVARLEQWIFVDRGTPGAPRPYAIAAGPGHMLCVYSTPERAREGALAGGLVAEGTTVPMFSVPLPEALDWALSLGERGVVGVTIDYPQIGAWCPLPNLERLKSERSASAPE